ncbi:hypothetical protein HDV05_007127 [Chytridiales sp. JEL 0842]|nr:hypothetical protein HDV05_007127 [Chytridiales sp. JEL 0842]
MGQDPAHTPLAPADDNIDTNAFAAGGPSSEIQSTAVRNTTTPVDSPAFNTLNAVKSSPTIPKIDKGRYTKPGSISPAVSWSSVSLEPNELGLSKSVMASAAEDPDYRTQMDWDITAETLNNTEEDDLGAGSSSSGLNIGKAKADMLGVSIRPPPPPPKPATADVTAIEDQQQEPQSYSSNQRPDVPYSNQQRKEETDDGLNFSATGSVSSSQLNSPPVISFFLARLQEDTGAVTSHHEKANALAYDLEALIDQVQDYEIKLDLTRQSLRRKEEEKKVIELVVEYMSARMNATSTHIEKLQGEVAKAEAELRQMQERTVVESKDFVVDRVENESGVKQAEQQRRVSASHDLKQQQNQHGSLDDPVCLDFNRGNCQNTTCALQHVCGYCRSFEHNFFDCPKKGCIYRPHRCIRCNGDHPVIECPDSLELFLANPHLKDITNSIIRGDISPRSEFIRHRLMKNNEYDKDRSGGNKQRSSYHQDDLRRSLESKRDRQDRYDNSNDARTPLDSSRKRHRQDDHDTPLKRSSTSVAGGGGGGDSESVTSYRRQRDEDLSRSSSSLAVFEDRGSSGVNFTHPSRLVRVTAEEREEYSSKRPRLTEEREEEGGGGLERREYKERETSGRRQSGWDDERERSYERRNDEGGSRRESGGVGTLYRDLYSTVGDDATATGPNAESSPSQQQLRLAAPAPPTAREDHLYDDRTPQDDRSTRRSQHNTTTRNDHSREHHYTRDRSNNESGRSGARESRNTASSESLHTPSREYKDSHHHQHQHQPHHGGHHHHHRDRGATTGDRGEQRNGEYTTTSSTSSRPESRLEGYAPRNESSRAELERERESGGSGYGQEAQYSSGGRYSSKGGGGDGLREGRGDRESGGYGSDNEYVGGRGGGRGGEHRHERSERGERERERGGGERGEREYGSRNSNDYRSGGESRSGGGGGERDRDRSDRVENGDYTTSASNNNESTSGGGNGSSSNRTQQPHCFTWNQSGTCKFKNKCRYRHQCMKCESFSHGELDCPNVMK